MAFEILQTPRDPESVLKYVPLIKDFRLLSLKTSPEAFSSTYEREVASTDDIWQSRLENPDATTFVAVDGDRIMSSLTILGPLPFGPEELPLSVNPWEFSGGRDHPELHWRFNGMFTLPEARGHGIAEALIQRAMQYGADEAAKAGKPFVGSIVVEKENVAARFLYEKCGFVFVKAENFEAHGKRVLEVYLMKTE